MTRTILTEAEHNIVRRALFRKVLFYGCNDWIELGKYVIVCDCFRVYYHFDLLCSWLLVIGYYRI